MKLKVTSLSGGRPSLLDLTMRWMFRMVDIALSLGVLATIFVSSSKKKQRIGDILANTAVIRIQNEASYISLGSIKSISDQAYEVTYPQITRYQDKDMLLIKQALNRYAKKSSVENKELVHQLYDRVTSELKIKPAPKSDKTGFLKKVLSDYVVLTR